MCQQAYQHSHLSYLSRLWGIMWNFFESSAFRILLGLFYSYESRVFHRIKVK